MNSAPERRVTVMKNGPQRVTASLPHDKMMNAIELLGSRVAPVLREEFAAAP